MSNYYTKEEVQLALDLGYINCINYDGISCIIKQVDFYGRIYLKIDKDPFIYHAWLTETNSIIEIPGYDTIREKKLIKLLL